MMKIFLDDERQPQQCKSYMVGEIGRLIAIYNDDWEIVKTYQAFIKIVSLHFNEITHISLDHDLAEIKYNHLTGKQSFRYLNHNGLDCAIWLKNFYSEKGLPLPIIFVHSKNNEGIENIKLELNL